MTGAPNQRDESGNQTTARLLVVTAALMWSSGGFFMKSPLFEGWPGPVMAFWRAAFASLVLLPMVRRPRWSLKLVPMVLVFAAMNVTYLTSMSITEASIAIWLQGTAPAWVFLVTLLWLREPVHFRDWLMLGFAAAGMSLILFHELQGEAPAGVAYGLLSGVFYAGIVLSLRQLRDYESLWLVALNHVVTAVILAPVMVYQAAYHDLWPQGQQWLFLAGFGILQMGIPYALFAHSLRTIASHEAAGIGLLEPVLLPVWVYLAWHNTATYTPPRWWTLIGGSLILTGLLIRYLGANRRRIDKVTSE